eukprot:TRINITY_DN11770_c0_g1_i4.p1 TRINITY_DN11770_c0_g1~~TRINITY_DN11770_c0_g1_i4.p1  ORF type:complete len:632 (+),score=44.19 TRINITY_DN11770_c0_g1_i4:139-2034(+)
MGQSIQLDRKVPYNQYEFGDVCSSWSYISAARLTRILHCSSAVIFLGVFLWHFTPQASLLPGANSYGWFFRYLTFCAYTLQSFWLFLCTLKSFTLFSYEDKISTQNSIQNEKFAFDNNSKQQYYQDSVKDQNFLVDDLNSMKKDKQSLNSEISIGKGKYVIESQKFTENGALTSKINKSLNLNRFLDDFACSLFPLANVVTIMYYTLAVITQGCVEGGEIQRPAWLGFAVHGLNSIVVWLDLLLADSRSFSDISKVLGFLKQYYPLQNWVKQIKNLKVFNESCYLLFLMVVISALSSFRLKSLNSKSMGQFFSKRSESYSTNCLWERIGQVFESANESGAAAKFDSCVQIVRDEKYDVDFVIRLAPALAKKAKAKQQEQNSKEGQKQEKKAFNPFLPYNEKLWIQHLSPTHTLLMNKFYIVDNHVLVVTRHFEEQTNPLYARDFEALLRVLEAFPGYGGLGFFNCGPQSGYSQQHKHIQVVPLPFDGDATNENRGTPFDSIIEGILKDDQSSNKNNTGVVPLKDFPFKAFGLKCANSLSPEHLEEQYKYLLKAVQESVKNELLKEGEELSYNLIVTQKWMMMVPRSKETYGPCSINALGFAGTLIAKSEEDLLFIKEQGPMQMLTELAFKW